MMSSTKTSVSYHSPKCTISDEIKICLPAKLSPKLHLFFTISHINVRPKSKKEKPEDISVPVAYAILPLITSEGS